MQVDIVAHPGSGANRVRLRDVDAGLAPGSWQSQCGPNDDRLPSADPRSARILPIGCTGWLIDDCKQCFLTAGHCTGGTSVIQFNVPPSNPDGSINNPSPDDQYSVDPASMQTNGGLGVGNDWGYFGCFANSNTGLTAAEAQGSTFVLANPPPVSSNNIRITGYGVDSSPPDRNQVQQTHVGPLVTSTSTTVQYQADTEGGNSGSPVIWEETGEAVGIHTHGGCSTGGTGQNSGTSSTHPDLQDALASPQGICGAGITTFGTLPTLVPATVPLTLTVESLGTPVAGSVMAHYRYQGGSFTAVMMNDIGGGLFSVDLPAPDCGDLPEFYFSAQDADCGLVTLPEGAPGQFYSALVGTENIQVADNFEADMGWTAVTLGATSGAWQRGVPINDPNWAYDPVSDSDGSGQCYLTQNQPGNTDVDAGSQRLTSFVFDLSAPAAIVSYDYFLNLTDSGGTDRMLVEANNAGGAGAWTQVALHDTGGGLNWRTHSLTSADFANAGVPGTSTMQLRWTVNDSDPQSIVEAGLDAFKVFEIDCGEIGTRYCSPGEVNSSGAPGAMRVQGSTVVADDDLTLRATQLPPESNIGYFIMGQGMNTFVPPGSSGPICVSPGLLRFLPPVNNTTELNGGFERTVGTSGPVSGNITPGSTWNFQAWHRDFLGGDSNLTDAVSVTFQ